MDPTHEAVSMPILAGSQSVPAEESLSEAIVYRVSMLEAEDAVSLPPLFHVVDPDALESLFKPFRDGTSRERGHITFQYYGYNVTVNSERILSIQPIFEE